MKLFCSFLTTFLVLSLGVSCAESEMTVEEQCAAAMEQVAACYPGVSYEAECNGETLKAFQKFDMESEDCEGVKKIGKADWFAFDGCAPGEHECGLIFCCDDYVVTWFPQESDWDIVPVVQALHGAIPADELATLQSASRDDFLDGMSVVYEQAVVEYEGQPARDMAVEVSVGLIEVDYDAFQQRLPAADWGIQLAHYLGGEVIVYESDDLLRPTRQLERMVLSPFPCDWDIPLTNMDMTKVEVIDYTADKAVVYWRVMYSDNDSTETDVGSVTFERYDETSTLVTYHSAHRLNAPGGIHIPNDIVKFVLKTFFVQHILHYGNIVQSYY